MPKRRPLQSMSVIYGYETVYGVWATPWAKSSLSHNARHSHRLLANLIFSGMIHPRVCPKEASHIRFQIRQVLVPSPMPLGRFPTLLALSDHCQQRARELMHHRAELAAKAKRRALLASQALLLPSQCLPPAFAQPHISFYALARDFKRTAVFRDNLWGLGLGEQHLMAIYARIYRRRVAAS